MSHTPQHVHNPTSPCSCTIQHNGAAESIVYCPTHRAAPALVAALEKALDYMAPTHNNGHSAEWTERTITEARAALALAKETK